MTPLSSKLGKIIKFRLERYSKTNDTTERIAQRDYVRMSAIYSNSFKKAKKPKNNDPVLFRVTIIFAVNY